MFKLSQMWSPLWPSPNGSTMYHAGSNLNDFSGRIGCSNRFHGQGLNPDHCFVATANESGVQDDREKEMEENMNEVRMMKMIFISNWMTVICLKVSATIVNLRNMANDIGNVTKAQNEMLNR